MARALLRSGSLTEFHPLGAVGKPVYSAASQLRAAVRRLYGDEAADVFAIPKRHDQGDVIDWYAPHAGAVVPWSAATPEERNDALLALRSTRERLAAQSQALQAETETSERKVFGKLLAQATHIPGDDHIYIVDGRPVMTFWGFQPLNAPSGFDVIGHLVSAPAPAAEADQPETDGAAASWGAAPAPAADEGGGRRWWWWLALIPLLLLLLLFGMKSCGVPLPYSDWLPTLPFAEAPQPPSSALPPDLKPLLGADGRPLWRDGMALYRDGAGRTVAIDGEGRRLLIGPDGQAIPGQTEPGVPTPETGPGKAPGAEPTMPTDAARPADPTRPENGNQPQDAPGTPPPNPPLPTDNTPANTPGSSPAGANSGAPLTIPDKAIRDGDTGFLNGAWRSISGLQDKAGNPVDLSYEFTQGQGPVTLRRMVGNQQQTCTGTVGSAMEGGRLILNQGEVRCPDGTVFQKSKVACSPGAGGQARCQGINENGSTYDVDIVK